MDHKNGGSKYFLTMPLCSRKSHQMKAVDLTVETAKHIGVSASSFIDNLFGPCRPTHPSDGLRRRDSSFGPDNAYKADADRMIETLIIMDCDNAKSIAAARIMSMYFNRKGNYAVPIGVDTLQGAVDVKAATNIDHERLIYVVFLTPTVHLNPVAVCYIHMLMRNNLDYSQDQRMSVEKFISGASSTDGRRRSLVDLMGAWKLITVRPGQETILPVSEWKQQAMDGHLWGAEFWEIVTKTCPDLTDDVHGRRMICEDFTACQRILAFQFSCDQAIGTIEIEFEAINKRLSFLQNTPAIQF